MTTEGKLASKSLSFFRFFTAASLFFISVSTAKLARQGHPTQNNLQDGVAQTPKDLFYNSKLWDTLPSTVQASFATLGYDESTWNEGGVVSTDWGELTHDQRIAALRIGYTPELWDSTATSFTSMEYGIKKELMFPPPQRLLDARNRRWRAMPNNATCKFPSFYDGLRKTHKYTGETAYTAEYDYRARNAYFLHWYNQSAMRRDAEYNKIREERAARGDRSLTFLHIGKAGGSSLACNIREALPFAYHCHPGHKKLEKTFLRDPETGEEIAESAISKQVTCYVHTDKNLGCYDSKSYLVNIRDPIDRASSWYHYEHIENAGFSSSTRDETCGKQMIYTCYNSWDDLASFGLAGTRPPTTRLLKVGYNLTEEECRHWAWATVQGSVPATWHNFFNYEVMLSLSQFAHFHLRHTSAHLLLSLHLL